MFTPLTRKEPKPLFLMPMSNFLQRLITGTVFVLVLVGALLLGGWYLHILFGVITLLGLQEFYKLTSKSVSAADQLLGPILGTLIYFFGIYAIRVEEPSAWNYLLSLSIISFVLFGATELSRKKKHPFENIGIGITGIVYIVLPFLLVNWMSWNTESESSHDIWPVLAIFILTWTNDTFAYLTGRQFGKHKMFERISPKKTWEGFAGGLFFSISAGLIIAWTTEQNLFTYAVYGIAISVFGTIGDLVESMLKRSIGVKDSGTILPGHGGILDRFDAVLFAIPVIYVLHTFFFAN